MKALTVHQPWAWAIIHAGKDIENRTWATKHRGPLAIHAGKRKPTRAEMEEFREYCFDLMLPDPPEKFVFGAIIGTVTLLDCVTESPSPWWQGQIGWKLETPVALRQPLPLSGQLGIFDVDL